MLETWQVDQLLGFRDKNDKNWSYLAPKSKKDHELEYFVSKKSISQTMDYSNIFKQPMVKPNDIILLEGGGLNRMFTVNRKYVFYANTRVGKYTFQIKKPFKH